MTKLDWILAFAIPQLTIAAQLLRDKDANSTGADDEAAEALEYAITRLWKWKNDRDNPALTPGASNNPTLIPGTSNNPALRFPNGV